MQDWLMHQILMKPIDIASVGSSARGLSLNLPQWAIYLLATIFLIIGLLAFVWFYFMNKKIQNYRNRQLAEFRRQNRHRKNLSYKEAGLYLPAWKRMLWFLPIFIGIVFLVWAVAFYSGSALRA